MPAPAWWRRGEVRASVCFAVALMVVAGFVVVRDPASTPSATSSTAPLLPAAPSTSTTSAPPTDGPPRVVRAAGSPLLDGAGSWTAYAQSATAVFRIDLRSGEIVRTPTPELVQDGSFVAVAGGVVVKTVGWPPGMGAGPVPVLGALIRDGRPAEPLSAGLAVPGHLYPAPGGDLWLVPEDESGVVTFWAERFTLTGVRDPAKTVPLPGSWSSAAGSFVFDNAHGVYEAGHTRPHLLGSGLLLGVSARRLLVWDCDAAAVCGPTLVDRRSGTRRSVARAREPLRALSLGEPTAPNTVGDLSPDGRHLSLTLQDGRGAFRTNVVSLDDGRVDQVPGAATDTDPNTQSVWTPDSRWLLTLTDHRLQTLDTTTGALRTIDLDGADLLHLTMLGATGG